MTDLSFMLQTWIWDLVLSCVLQSKLAFQYLKTPLALGQAAVV